MTVKKTPRSNGVFLREDEIADALAMNTLYHNWDRSIEKLADLYGWALHWRAPDRVAIVSQPEDGSTIEMWLPKKDPFHNLFRFAHEVHHIWYAPQAVACRDLSNPEIARWEAKANSFGALVVMPLLEYSSSDLVRRAFGPDLEHAAHARLQHFKKYGW